MQQRRSSYKSSFAQLLRCALCYAALVGRLLSCIRSHSYAWSHILILILVLVVVLAHVYVHVLSVSQSVSFFFGGCFTFGFLLIPDDASVNARSPPHHSPSLLLSHSPRSIGCTLLPSAYSWQLQSRCQKDKTTLAAVARQNVA